MSNAISSLTPHKPDLTHLLVPARLVVLNAPDSLIHPQVIQSLALRTAQGKRVGLIIGHNRFALHALTRSAHYLHIPTTDVLNRIDLSRAFTCFQMHQRIQTIDEKILRQWHTLYVLGLLDTFYDESVPYRQVARLLQDTLLRLQQIVKSGLPVLITVSLPKQLGREGLIKLVADMTDEYWEFAKDNSTAESAQLEMPLRMEPQERK
ncbi:MAG: hypothetical protein HZB51_11850 [Chloroflexi bacterium]|nr:hypothetical protein [Chloroflexota bacterium]